MRILVVDDNQDIRCVIGSCLMHLGQTVSLRRSGGSCSTVVSTGNRAPGCFLSTCGVNRFGMIRGV